MSGAGSLQVACIAEVVKSDMLYSPEVALEEADAMYRNDEVAAEAADHYVEGGLPAEEFRLVVKQALDRQSH